MLVILSFEELRPKGVPFSKPHLNRLIRSGAFPRPVKLGPRKNGWILEEIDEWLAERIRARTSAAA
jgi:prophage regulatory protein